MSAPASRTAASERGGRAPPARLTFHCFFAAAEQPRVAPPRRR